MTDQTIKYLQVKPISVQRDKLQVDNDARQKEIDSLKEEARERALLLGLFRFTKINTRD